MGNTVQIGAVIGSIVDHTVHVGAVTCLVMVPTVTRSMLDCTGNMRDLLEFSTIQRCCCRFSSEVLFLYIEVGMGILGKLSRIYSEVISDLTSVPTSPPWVLKLNFRACIVKY